MTLTEFLLARIAEDEATARASIQPDQMYPWGDRKLPPMPVETWSAEVRGYLGGTWGEHCARWSPLRVIAEHDAKRRVIEECREWVEEPGDDYGAQALADFTLRFLALPYADHPDYDAAWKR